MHDVIGLLLMQVPTDEMPFHEQAQVKVLLYRSLELYMATCGQKLRMPWYHDAVKFIRSDKEPYQPWQKPLQEALVLIATHKLAGGEA